MIKNNKGFTLVEILVALFLTGLVMAGLVGIWVSASNFATSNREELLYRNAMSVASRKIQRDMAEATAIDTNPVQCSASGGGNTAFLEVFKNYIPGENGSSGRCIAGEVPAIVVTYCFVGADNRINRREETINCAAPSLSCNCANSSVSGQTVKTETLAYNVVSNPAPVAQRDGRMFNGIQITFMTTVKVGRNKRPVVMPFDKSFTFLGGNQP